MRCVQRGEWPQDDAGGPIAFDRYQDAAPYLKERMGRYCSFCERWIATQLAVEHKQPKKPNPALEREWGNFLLACANCNSVKGAKNPEPGSVMWPDVDDTFGSLEYRPSGRISAREGLPEVRAQRILATLDLVGLNREPDLMGADHRWLDRLELWRVAQASREELKTRDTAQMRSLICRTAATRGGFSIWMTVFADDDEMRQALLAAFPGTVMRNANTNDL